jgi:protein-S-isoprenylcysteine O-methyltransferase Ste14
MHARAARIPKERIMTEVQVPGGQLLRLVLVRLVLGLAGLMAIFFLPAGTLGYWEAWVWLAVVFVPMLGALAYLWKNDRALLERRMRVREQEPAQSLFIKLSWIWFLLTFLIPGFDHRFGWSDVPHALVIAGAILVLLGYCMFFLVMRENTYASRVVEVEQGQKVIDTGPYSLVRHPMYLAAIIMYGFTPLALGSYWALLPSLLTFPPLLVLRIVNEEQVLRRELPAYEAYMQKVRYRLVPGVW